MSAAPRIMAVLPISRTTPPESRHFEFFTRKPYHDPERAIGQGKNPLGAQVVGEYPAQAFINEFRSIPWRSHLGPEAGRCENWPRLGASIQANMSPPKWGIREVGNRRYADLNCK